MTSTPAAVPTPIQHSLRISQMAVTADGKVCSLAYGSEFMLVESRSVSQSVIVVGRQLTAVLVKPSRFHSHSTHSLSPLSTFTFFSSHSLNSTGEILFNSSNSTPEAPIFKDSIRGFAMHSKAAALGKNLMAVITTDKKLTCLDISNPSAPTIISQVENMKRASTVCFSRDGKRIIIADKFGDVYANTTFESDGNHLLTGHVSMILDTIMSHDGKFLLTADRDEKVRVSRYPNCFQVESFCLGHTQFVSAICIPSFSPSTMLSGGGDRFICLWDFEKGVELDRFDLTPYWSKVRK